MKKALIGCGVLPVLGGLAAMVVAGIYNRLVGAQAAGRWFPSGGGWSSDRWSGGGASGSW